MPAEYHFSYDYTGTGNFSWNIGDAFPATQTVVVRHRFPQLQFPDFDDFRLRVIINCADTQIEWLSCSGTNFNAGIKYPLGVQSILNFDFQNLISLTSGSYNVNLIFALEGKYNDYWNQIDLLELDWRLTVVNSNPIKTEKQLYTVYYDKSANSISGELNVNILNNTGGDSLDFEGDGSTFSPVPSFTNSFNLALGSAVLLPATGEYLLNAFIRKSGQRIWAFQVKVVVIDAPIVVTPLSLNFWVKKSSNEVKTQVLSVLNLFNKAFTITSPSWLVLSQNSGNATVDINVSNAEPNTIEAGVYNGEIKLFYDDKVITIPVVLEVFSFFTHNFNEEYNFCLDQKKITVFQNNDTARFIKITATMVFRTPTETKTLVVPYTIPYFNQQAYLDIGKNIHRYFIKNRTSIFEEGTLIYHFDNKVHLYPCQLDLKIEELDADFKALYSESIMGKKFYPGKRPKLFPFMTNHGLRSRVYDSKLIFSFIAGLVTPEELFDIPVTKNGLEPGAMARAKVERFENKITFGDKKTVDAAGKSISFYQFPEGRELINVQWENQNLCPEWITLRGVSSKSEDFTHIFQDNVFTGGSEKFDTTSEKTITLNTGFILKAEEALISELMFSKFCILEMNGQYIKAAPSSAKIVTEDSTKQLIEFDLEFKVNGN